MAIISGGSQSSLAGTVAPAGAEPDGAPPRASREEAARSGAPRPAAPTRTGIVFVHGIGSQRPGETLLDWSRPIIKLVADWIAAARVPPAARTLPPTPASRAIDPATPLDPVAAAHVDFAVADLEVLELRIPAATAPDGRSWDAETWVLTEAWWASRVQPPSLGSMTSWLRADFGRVVDGIRRGIGDPAARDAHAEATYGGMRDPSWVNWIDRSSAERMRPVLGLVWSLAYGLLLLPYAAFRSIPIATLRDAVGLRQLDSFLVDWFGDMRILLRDPSQAASVRERLAETIRRLRADHGCDRIVVVAHSGGALVSFTTLTDPAYLADPRYDCGQVDKLVTLGQGLGLGWRLSRFDGGVPDGDRLGADIVKAQPNMRWVDFWSTYDPAPAGPFTPPTNMTIPVDSRAVRNRMSLLGDHGGYWDNDEEFLLPLVRELDSAADTRTGSRFFEEPTDQVVRVFRRKQRIGALVGWRWAVTAAAGLAFAAALVRGASGDDRLGNLGRWVVGLGNDLPGHELLAAPIDGVAGVFALAPAAPGWLQPLVGALVVGVVAGVLLWLVPRFVFGEAWQRLATGRVLGAVRTPLLRPSAWIGLAFGLALWPVMPDGLAGAVRTALSPDGGQVLVGVLLAVLVFLALALFGTGRWSQWDADERWRARQEPPLPTARRRWVVEGAVLVGAAATVAALIGLG